MERRGMHLEVLAAPSSTVQQLLSTGPAFAVSLHDDGLLAWVAQLDAKRTMNDPHEADMSESKAASDTDYLYNNCVDEVVVRFGVLS